MHILGLIPARSGSRRIPGKNTKLLGDKPLIAWTIEAAKKSRHMDRVLVSSDSPEIATLAKEWGAEAPFLRPEALSTDTASSADMAVHALEWLRRERGYSPEILFLLQPTSPFRQSLDIDQAIDLLLEQNAEAVVGVSSDLQPLSHLRQLDEKGFLRPMPLQKEQATTTTYRLNGAVYAIRTEVFLKQKTFFPSRTLPYKMSPESSLDIDTPLEMRFAEFLLNKGGAV